MWNPSLSRRVRAWLTSATLALLTLAATSAWAQDDPPGRVGRLADVQGGVSWFDHEQGQWGEAERNRPLTTGDRLSTAAQGRAELRVGSTVLRLGGATEIEVLRLDDERISFQLHSGALALRVRSREVAGEIDIVTAEAQLQPLRSGHFRIDRIDDTTFAGSWRGELRVQDGNGATVLTVASGQRAELWREGSARSLRQGWGTLPDDSFAEWVARDDKRDERSASSRYVSPEMTGAEDLDRNGRWDRHPEYGAIWYPLEVRAGWAPYRHGRWAWVRPWGWTWMDEAAWGFAPFHYGRWVSWGGRWGWVPGVYVPRPVFAPALVAWVGGAHWGVSVDIGGPTVGWLPLAPREVYLPHYRHTPVYRDRVNVHPPRGPQRPPAQVPTGPVMYGNQGVPGAVTVVPRDVLLQRQPVARAVVGPQPQGQASPPLVVVPPPVRRHEPAPVIDLRRGRAAPVPTPQTPAVMPGSPRPAPPAGVGPAAPRPPAAAVSPAAPKPPEREDERKRHPEGRNNMRERENQR